MRARAVRWTTPQASDRDAAFRERVLRHAVAILLMLVVASFLASILVFEDKWGLVSFPTLHIYGLLLCIVAARALAGGYLVAAGWLLVIFALSGASGVVLLSRQNGSIAGIFLSIPIFLMLPVIAAVVLPTSRILPVSVLGVAAYAVAHFAIPMGDFEVVGLQPEGMIAPLLLLMLFEGILLRQLRVEFDARLAEMHRSIAEAEDAKRQADIARMQAEADRHRAEDADRAKSQFLANTSHELRTPLNAIIGYDEAMLAGMVGSFTDQQRKLLGHIQHNARRLLALINDILDLSKVESGSVEVYAAPLNPTSVIEDVVENLRGLAEEKGISLRVQTSDSAPALIISDSRKLEQIVVNLLSNAIKFTDQGGVTVHVWSEADDQWVMAVEDTGIGIEPEAQEAIFDPFHQVDGSLKRRHKGTGLGLAITKRLVEMLGGTLQVESVPNSGSTFTVTLPRHYRAPAQKIPAVDELSEFLETGATTPDGRT